MCGIVGIADSNLSQQATLELLRPMTDAIVHRGPDDAGHWAIDGGGIGMRRLSIIDLAGGHQPISNEAGDIHVVCNGEIYNFRELRKKLIDRGHVFTTHSDTEVIVHLYEEKGLDCFADLFGMFAIAIWDQRQNRLILCRDRLGKKPLFYAHRNSRLLFGSEIKSLLAASPELREPNHARVAQFLQFGYLYEPDTIYRHIIKLPAGHFAVLSGDELTIRPYWELNFKPDETLSQSDWVERLDAALLEAVKCRLVSDVPLGVFLSGGIDSSAIVAYAHRAGLQPLKTFTIGFDSEQWDESADARQVANHFGTDHHELRLSSSELERSLPTTLQRIIEHVDEPFGDNSALPTYHISELARQHVTVILSGDGGDELFGGYSSYRGALFAMQYRRMLPQILGRHLLPAMTGAAGRLLPGNYGYGALRAAKIMRDSALPLAQAYRDKTSVWNLRELSQLLQPDVFKQSAYTGDAFYPEPLWNVFTSSRDVVSRLTDIDIRTYMRDEILVKVDRMSMAHSLEVRSPLLDHRVVELAATIPSKFKIQGNSGKVILKQTLAKHLPPRTLRKPKQGFGVPLRDWMRGSLAGLLKDHLLATGNGLPSEIFQPAKVESTLQEHLAGRADHSRKLWYLLVYATWHKKYQS